MPTEPSSDKPVEGRAGVPRVEAFSDGVLAIVVTIMVLEMHAPEKPGAALLWHLWPTFVAYALSYSYVAIYWVNHHRLFSHAKVVSGSLLWSNIALLFALSLVPFSASYLGKQSFSHESVVVYLVTMILPALGYRWLLTVIQRTGTQTDASRNYYRASIRKGLAAIAVYALGFPLSFLSPWLGVGCAALVAIFWMLPWSPLDRLFLRDRGSGSRPVRLRERD